MSESEEVSERWGRMIGDEGERIKEDAMRDVIEPFLRGEAVDMTAAEAIADRVDDFQRRLAEGIAVEIEGDSQADVHIPQDPTGMGGDADAGQAG